MGDQDLTTVRVQQNTVPYLGLVISRSRHDPAENLHSLRQLTVVVRIVRVADNTRLEVLCSDEESDETKQEADTCTDKLTNNKSVVRRETDPLILPGI